MRRERLLSTMLACTALASCNPIDPPATGLLLIGLEVAEEDSRASVRDIDGLAASVRRVEVVHRSDPADPSTEQVVTVLAEPVDIAATGLLDHRPQVLARLVVPVGRVYQVRFVLDDATVTRGSGEVSSVVVPSGSQSGLKLVNRGGEWLVDIHDQQTSAVLATLRPSHDLIGTRGTGFILKPVISAREVDPSELTFFFLDQLIVLFEETATRAQIDALNAEIGVTVLRREPLTNLYLLHLPVGVSIEDAIDHYLRHPELISSVLPNGRLPPSLVPNDDFVGEALLAMEGAAAWDSTTGSYGPVIAIVDSGFDLDHPDLVQNMWLNEAEVVGFVGDRNGDGIVDRDDADVDGDGYVTFRDLNDPRLDGLCPRSRNPNSPADICDPLDLADGDPMVTVGFENGVDEDCNGRVDDLVGWDYWMDDNQPHDRDGDGFGHGTLIAGLAAAVGDNAAGGTGAIFNSFGGVVGATWTARILPLRAESTLHSKTGALGLATQDYQADVVVFSGSVSLRFGFPRPITVPAGCAETEPPGGGSVGDWTAKFRALWARHATSCRSLVIAPTTDCGFDDDLTEVLTYPAEFRVPNSVSVSGVDLAGAFVGQSNTGQIIQLASIGQLDMGSLPILQPDDRVLPAAGGDHVSPASGVIGGAAALMISADLSWQGSACALRDRLLANATATTLPPGSIEGDRLLNLRQAVLNTAGSTRFDCPFECAPPRGCRAP